MWSHRMGNSQTGHRKRSYASRYWRTSHSHFGEATALIKYDSNLIRFRCTGARRFSGCPGPRTRAVHSRSFFVFEDIPPHKANAVCARKFLSPTPYGYQECLEVDRGDRRFAEYAVVELHRTNAEL